MSTFPSTTAPIIIENINIRQDTQGRFCLNDLHKAAGGEIRHRPAKWLQNKQVQELIDEISNDVITSHQRNQALEPIVTRNGSLENGGGTFAVRHLVYAYTSWISPKFHLKVYDIFDAYVTGQIKTSIPTLPNFSNPAEAARAWADEYDKRLVAEQKVEYLQPKAAFVDNYVEANGTLGLREAAKALNIKPNYFTQKLRDDHILYYNVKKQNVAAQDYLDRGYFTVKTALHGANKKHLCYV